MSKYNNNKNSEWNTSSNPSKNIDEHGKQPSLEDDYVRTIVTRISISTHISHIVKSRVITKTHRFSDKY